ncbi:hypothetical protein SAMN05443665_101720 [Actinomadura meyerae]|uniref:Uncharacterized protein n=1 Tax=Actinomadura meyerae TaxID=240840 RepID=A0A239K6Z1_9ACTN|nr:hypothetical protein SAMN05443665_101720 [Actinomadura meyerae]
MSTVMFGAGAAAASTPIPSSVTPAAACTFTVVPVAEFAVTVAARNPAPACTATVTTGWPVNAPAGHAKTAFPAPLVTPVA